MLAWTRRAGRGRGSGIVLKVEPMGWAEDSNIGCALRVTPSISRGRSVLPRWGPWGIRGLGGEGQGGGSRLQKV